MHPTERMVNLVALLLDARRPLTFERIRELLPAYAQGDLASAKRMFERDKDALRDLGVPVELAPTDAWEVEEGYVIPRGQYYLPEIEFTAEEISALFVAAQTGEPGAPAEQAMRKLLYGAEGGVITPSGPLLAARSESEEASLRAILEAIGSQASIRFGYKTAAGAASERHVDPYGLVTRTGNWYVVGLDRERGEIRSFRLSRLATGVEDAGEGSAPPAGFQAASHVREGPFEADPDGEPARVALSPEVAWWATGGLGATQAQTAREDGWVEVTVADRPLEVLASWILSLGPDAEALSPPALREEVVRRLEAALDAA